MAQSSVSALKWSPDYRVLCVMYDRGHMSLFSVFGSLLYDSRDCLYFNCSSLEHNTVRLFEFGVHGYSLWIYMQSAASAASSSLPSSGLSSSDPLLAAPAGGELVKLKILKSALIGNGYMCNVEHVALNGERECYVCLNMNKAASGPSAESDDTNSSATSIISDSDTTTTNTGKKLRRPRRLEPKYQYPSMKLGGNSIFQVITFWPTTRN
jgi:hypothetical protein